MCEIEKEKPSDYLNKDKDRLCTRQNIILFYLVKV